MKKNQETRIIIHLHQVRQESPHGNDNQHPNKQQGNILQTRKIETELEKSCTIQQTRRRELEKSGV